MVNTWRLLKAKCVGQRPNIPVFETTHWLFLQIYAHQDSSSKVMERCHYVDREALSWLPVFKVQTSDGASCQQCPSNSSRSPAFLQHSNTVGRNTVMLKIFIGPASFTCTVKYFFFTYNKINCLKIEITKVESQF